MVGAFAGAAMPPGRVRRPSVHRLPALPGHARRSGGRHLLSSAAVHRDPHRPVAHRLARRHDRLGGGGVSQAVDLRVCFSVSPRGASIFRHCCSHSGSASIGAEASAGSSSRFCSPRGSGSASASAGRRSAPAGRPPSRTPSRRPFSSPVAAVETVLHRGILAHPLWHEHPLGVPAAGSSSSTWRFWS